MGNFGNRTLTADQPGRRCSRAAPFALPLNPTGMAVAPSGATAYVCGGAGVVAVATVGLTVGPAGRLPDVAQGIALTADGDDGVGDAAGGLAGPGDAGHRQGRPAAPPRRPPSAIVIGAGLDGSPAGAVGASAQAL